ncbi:MAG TPA: alpha/beta hydrolase [Rubrobacteraceae bacterium]|nr:alpha/beta hydrolase [Rubrobacteraceae bacterium]
MTSGTADINGVNLYYEDAGTGPPLVLLHDGLLDCRIWDDPFEAAGNYRVVRYDMRGHGRFGISADKFSHVEDLRDLLGFLDTRSSTD